MRRRLGLMVGWWTKRPLCEGSSMLTMASVQFIAACVRNSGLLFSVRFLRRKETMVVVISGPEPRQRNLTPQEEIDHEIEHSTYVGVTWENSGQVWKNIDGKVTRPGIIGFEPIPVVSGSTVAGTLRQIVGPDVVLHDMALQPGRYYPRIVRPGDQNPCAKPNIPNLGSQNKQEIYGSARHFSSLIRELDDILDSVEPTENNFSCFGNRIRNLLLLACTESENQMRGILRENGVAKPKYDTNDFVRLLEPMRLQEYSVKFSEMPWLGEFAPFSTWNEGDPTQSLSWYKAYNAAKHDRTVNLHQASLKRVFQALAALWVLLSAQYGAYAWRNRSGSDRVFTLVECPRWRYSEVYIYPYGEGQELEPVEYFSS